VAVKVLPCPGLTVLGLALTEVGLLGVGNKAHGMMAH
jgi:hypothetical protein